MIVKIDVDGVLRNFTESVHNVFVQEKIVPSDMKMPNVRTWNVHRYYKEYLDRERFYNTVFNSGFSKSIFIMANLYKGAFGFITALRTLKYTVVISTHNDTSNSASTLLWLRDHNVKYDYYVSSDGLDKNLILPECVLIDDKFQNVRPTDILFTRPWNIRYEHPNRCNNYNEVIRKLIEMEKNNGK